MQSTLTGVPPRGENSVPPRGENSVPPRGENRFKQFLESLRGHESYHCRAFALEALAHNRIPDPLNCSELDAWRMTGHFIASQEVARRVWKVYMRWIAIQPDGEERAR